MIGPGGIGSTFAFQLARAGHEVTVVARGKRLEQLQRDQAVLTSDGQRATVRVTAVLDETTAWELLLVTVLASQVDALLPAPAGERSAAGDVHVQYVRAARTPARCGGRGALRFRLSGDPGER